MLGSKTARSSRAGIASTCGMYHRWLGGQSTCSSTYHRGNWPEAWPNPAASTSSRRSHAGIRLVYCRPGGRRGTKRGETADLRYLEADCCELPRNLTDFHVVTADADALGNVSGVLISPATRRCEYFVIESPGLFITIAGSCCRSSRRSVRRRTIPRACDNHRPEGRARPRDVHAELGAAVLRRRPLHDHVLAGRRVGNPLPVDLLPESLLSSSASSFVSSSRSVLVVRCSASQR